MMSKKTTDTSADKAAAAAAHAARQSADAEPPAENSYQEALRALGGEKAEVLSPDQQAEAERLQSELAELKVASEKSRDQMLRALADVDNIRRIAQRDVEKAHKFALGKFAEALMPVVDSLDQGLAMIPADQAAVRQGMELTYKLLTDAFEKFGIHAIDPLGETFNPDLHEALSMQQQADAPPNTVLMVIQKGYMLHGRVLRPARVIVNNAQ